MENLSTKVQISFPKSSEDHRLQLIAINGAVFAIIHSPLESQGPICLQCEEWSLILLAPIKSESNVLISGINVICLSEITSDQGSVNIHASHQLVKFANLIKGSGAVCEMGEKGEFQFDDDPGALLHYYRVFDDIVGQARQATPDCLSQAHEKFIGGLCTLADKIQEHPENLTLNKVFDVWKIPTIT